MSGNGDRRKLGMLSSSRFLPENSRSDLYLLVLPKAFCSRMQQA
jgi:hypothetical protein